VTFGVSSDNTVTLLGTGDSVTFGSNSDSNTLTLQGSGESVTFGAGSSRNMVTLQGSGDSVNLSSGSDNTVVIPSGGTPVTIGGTGNSGTISGYATIKDFATSTDFLELAGAPVATANTSGDVNGTDSTLTIGGSKVGEDSITNGIITFYTNSGTSLSLNATNTSAVAAAVQYLESNNLGAAGDTVAFTATINGIAQTYIYEQVGASPNPANDILVDLSGVTVTNLATLISGGNLSPAGVAGSPINLALANPSGAETSAVTVTLTGVPSDWSLNEGTSLGNGTWTVETYDLSALTVTTAAAYAGAMVLGVTETWTNADGSTGTAFVSDNVEAYAPGSPIFALSGNDNLTGSQGSNTFVFDQLIGNDAIYNFNVATDKIDLIGFANAKSFSNIQSNIADDANGNAVLTLGNGETITLYGVNAASLVASDFVFNQIPTTENAGTMMIGDGAILPLTGIVNNTGTIELNSVGGQTALEVGASGITLQGGGQITLSDSAVNFIFGATPTATLTNVDNTIIGAGQLGSGEMTLINEGTIIASGHNALVIDTGVNIINNSGVLEAIGGSELDVLSDVANSGLLWANGGDLTISGDVSGNGHAIISGSGMLEFAGASSESTSFAAGAAGTLELDNPSTFTGTISGLSSGDYLDLGNIVYGTGTTLTYSHDWKGDDGILTVSDGTQTDSIVLLGRYSAKDFVMSENSTGTVITYVPSGPADYAASNLLGNEGTQKIEGVSGSDRPTAESWSETLLYHGHGNGPHLDANTNWINAIDAHTGTAAQVTGNDWIHAIATGALPSVDPVNHATESWQHVSSIALVPEPANIHFEEIHHHHFL